MNTLFIAVLSVAFSVAAQFSLKAGMSSPTVQSIIGEPLTLPSALTIITNRYVLGGFILYGLGAVVWLGVLAAWDVSKAYPIVGQGFVFTATVGWLVGEHITLSRVFGIALICAGVIVVSRS